jgi:hypothetical protein
MAKLYKNSSGVGSYIKHRKSKMPIGYQYDGYENMSEELKPCQYCNGTDFLDYGASWVVCAICGRDIPQHHAEAPTSTILTIHITGDREDAERIGALAAAQWPAVSGHTVSNQ